LTVHPRSRWKPGAGLALARGAILCAVCLFLDGCKTTDPGAEALAQPLSAEGPRDSRGCVQAIASDSQYAPLSDKLYLGIGAEYRPSDAGNPTKPDEGEIELLRAVHGDLQKCRAIALAETLQPAERQRLAASHTADDKIWSDMLAGRLTWGKFNTARRVVAMQQQARLNLPAARPKEEALPSPKYDFNSIDYGQKVLPQFSRSPGDEPGPRLIGDLPSRSSYCDRMSNTSYCSYRR
jgi:hypothetical protein